MNELPIAAILPELKATLTEQANLVLVAPPGAGKTTRVPLALLGEPWLAGRKIIVLEPRRLAARAVARYMATLLDEPVGRTVGYRVHRDTCISAHTRIEVVTEGVLTRLLQSDPALENVGLVIFDEFHERSLQADLGLALALECQSVLREDLKLIVMSATLETQAVASLLGDAPVIRSEGKLFPVQTFYLPATPEERLEKSIADRVQLALRQQTGDILVFLPGAGEIRRVERLLAGRTIDEPVKITCLYGDLSPDRQDEALIPSRSGQRKVVLSTAIAETSLTVEGIGVVIDSGLMRVPRFSPRTGMSRLETAQVSRSSADQRRGRAGRLGPGSCYRLWTEQEDARLILRNTPEILESDLVPLALELAAWGVSEPQRLRWIDLPPQAAWCQAVELLQELGAVGADGRITGHGQRMNRTGLHPRLAHMLLTAVPLGLGQEACYLAALLTERDVLRSTDRSEDVDLRLRLAIIRQGQAGLDEAGQSAYIVDRNRLGRLRQEIAYWQKAFGIAEKKVFDSDGCGMLLAMAYPDRIGQGRGKGRFLLRNGRGAVLKEQQPLAAEPYIVAADLADGGADSRIFAAAPVTEQALRQHLAGQIAETLTVSWDSRVKVVRAVKSERLGALVLKEESVAVQDREQVLAALLQGIRLEGLALLPWTPGSSVLLNRLRFIQQLAPDWPAFGEESLLSELEIWLAPYLDGIRNAQQLDRIKLGEALLARLTWQQQQTLNQWAPTHLAVPSGRRIAVDYSDSAAPVLAVKLQELFGATETPTIAGGRAPVTLQLLSPAGRPIQITRDLASFWRQGYFAVKKDLKGRYPKHYWPDDPLTAAPTNRVRPREADGR